MKSMLTMMIGIVFLLSLFPSVLATEDKLLDTTIGISASTTFIDQQSKQRELRVESVDTQKEECVIRLDAVMKTIRENEEIIINNLRVRLNHAEETGCEIIVKPIEGEKTYVGIPSFTINGVSPDKNGYYKIPEGKKISFTAVIENTGSTTLYNVPYIFYNNGYPTGEGATKKVEGVVTLPAFQKTKVELWMDFSYDDETLYKAGSFLTTFIVDPKETKVHKVYTGFSVYLDAPDETHEIDCKYHFDQCIVFGAGSELACKSKYLDCIGENKPSSGNQVTEEVKCLFNGASTKQKCYPASDGTSSVSGGCYAPEGSDTCIATVTGKMGEKVTWKSSCGGYAYTVIDGVSEYANFMCNDLPPPQPSECEEKGEILLSLNKDYVFAIATESVTIHFANVINKGENYGNVFTLQSNLVSHPTTTPPMPKGSSYGYEMSSGNLLITVAGGEISWIPPDYVKPKEATVQLLLTYKPYHCGSEPPQQDCRSAYYRCVEEGGSEEECRRVLQKCLPSVDRKPLCSAYHDMCKGLGPDNCIASCVKKGGDAVECKELYYLCQGDTDFVDRPGEKYCDQGCYANSGTNKCVPYGTRLQIKGDASYCGVDGSTHLQKRDGESAENNYECVSNSARYGVCENVAEQTSVMQKIFGWLSRLFGGGTEPQPVSKEISNFEECVAAGYPMLKSYPAQCKTSDGKTFVQDVS